MTTYRDPVPESLAYFVVTTFMFTAAALCLCVAVVLGTTLGEDEHLVEVIFWPLVGAFGFTVMIVSGSDTNPTPLSCEQKE